MSAVQGWLHLCKQNDLVKNVIQYSVCLVFADLRL